MSHIHLPDGILPVWLWVAGYALTALLVGVLWQRGKATSDPRRFALLGVFAAIMMLAMSIEVPPVGLHVNLSVVTGIILGGRLGILAALIVNLMLAFLGHGGITVVGLNALVVSTEMMVGYLLFRSLMRARLRLPVSGFLSTVVGLACGTGVSFAVILAGGRWINAALAAGTVHLHEMEGPRLIVSRLAVLMFGLGAVGWVFEALLTTAILVALARIDRRLIGLEEAD